MWPSTDLANSQDLLWISCGTTYKSTNPQLIEQGNRHVADFASGVRHTMSICWHLLLSKIWLESRLLRLSCSIAAHEYTGLAKKWDHYIWRRTFSAYIFEMPKPISTIFGTHQRRFIRNTSVDLKFAKFIKKWRHHAKVNNFDFAFNEC